MPNDLIPGAQAAGLLGVSTVCLFHWRKDGRGPKAHAVERTKTTHYMFSRAECLEYVRSRLDLEERLTRLEQSMDRLTDVLGTLGRAD